ncbi:MAG: FAD-binding oxidoreductase [Verrucomicrobiales bacterium]
MSQPNPSSATAQAEWIKLLQERIPSTSVDPVVRGAHGGDKWFAHAMPAAVVEPRNTGEVQETMRIASEFRVPVTPRGAGVGYVGGCVPVQGGILLSLEAMGEILEIHAADGLALVQPAVRTAALQEAVRAKHLFYPPDPASRKDSSLGGNVATNAGGPSCLKYGVTRNYVLGLEVVLASGEILRTGGRTHKNKTGFDLTSLFVGSEGLLGVITEITLRLLPLPPGRASLSAACRDAQHAASVVGEIFRAGFLPCALEIADAFTLQAARAHLGQDKIPAGDAHVLIDLDGQIESVGAEKALLAALLEKLGVLSLRTAEGQEACEELWELRRGFSASLRASGLTKLNEDVVVPRGRLVDLINFAQGLQKETGFPIACFGHAGDGNIHVNVMAADYDSTEVKTRVQEVLDRLFSQVLAWGGSITGEHGVGLAKARWWGLAISDVSQAVHNQVKTALDPKGILNPGKFAHTNAVHDPWCEAS